MTYRLYAFNAHDCWIITNKIVGTLFDALRDGTYVGTSYARQPPATWELAPYVSLPVYVLGRERKDAA